MAVTCAQTLPLAEEVGWCLLLTEKYHGGTSGSKAENSSNALIAVRSSLVCAGG